jgi:hypothetical protein
MRFASIIEKPLNETNESIRCTSAFKKRIIKREDVLTHRKLDEIIRHSFPLGLEEEDRTADEDSDFSDDDVEGSDLSHPGQTEDPLSLDSESNSDEEQLDIARADLEHSITHLWDVTQDMANIDDARFILHHGTKFKAVNLILVRDLPTGRLTEVILDANIRVQVCSTNVSVVDGRLESYRHNDGRGSRMNDLQDSEEVKCEPQLFANVSSSEI